MKRFIFILFLVLFASRLDAVPVTGTIAPLATNSNYSATDTVYGKGGVWTGLADTTWLTNLNRYPLARRQAGQLAILTNGVMYQLGGDLTTWTLATPISVLNGSGTNTLLDNPTITNLAGFSLSQEGYYSFGSTAGGNSLFTIGDSITYGSSAVQYTNTYAYKLASTLGLSLTNIANPSFTIDDANWSAFYGWYVTNTHLGSGNPVYRSPASITENQTYSVLIGFNDVRTATTTTTAFRSGLDHLLHWLSIPDASKKFAQNADAETGSWSDVTFIGAGDIGRHSTSGTMTFSNIVGTEIYLGYIGWATNITYGTLTVTVDGVAQSPIVTAGAAYGNRAYISGTNSFLPNQLGPYGNGIIDFCPQLLTVASLGLTAHTVTVSVSAGDGYVLWCAGNGWPRSTRAGPNVFVGTILRQNGWTAPGSDTLQGSFNSQLIAAVGACRSAGLQVILAPTASYYDPLTEQDVDGVHPDDAGHAAIAAAFEANSGMNLTTYGGLSIQSDAAVGAGSFTTLSVSGISSLGGTVTLTGSGTRLLVNPTISSSGTVSRFGFGLNSGSSIALTHSLSTVDRVLSISGNSIGCTLNSDNVTPQSLSIGNLGASLIVRGHETVAGNFTLTGIATMNSNAVVAGTLDVNGVVTLGEKILVFPVPQSGGFYTRLGQAVTTNSAIEIQYGDTTFDRRLSMTGNNVKSLVNSTGANANLSIGSVGTTTSTPGSLSVAETFNVTGTPAGGGQTTVLGTSTTTNSSVQFVFDDTSLDRRMSIYGNSIQSRVNSTAAAANMTIGLAGTTVTQSGNLSVSQGFDVPGVVSAGGQTTYFGTTATTNSAVRLIYDSDALDRRLQLSGNSISTVVNSTGNGANMNVGNASFTVAMQGNETVAGTLGVTGATTLGAGTSIALLKHGRATLVSGSATVTDSTVTVNSRISLTHANSGSGTNVLGLLYVGTRTASTSFVIGSTSGTDDSTVDWVMIEP